MANSVFDDKTSSRHVVSTPCGTPSRNFRELATMQLEFAEFWTFFGLCCSFAFLLAHFVTHQLTTPVRVKVVDKSRGIIRLRFRNLKYQKLASLSEEAPK